jgi:adenylosuccinate lyase
MLDKFAWLVEGLVVRPEQMRRNLELSRGLYFSQRLLLALVDSGLSRDEAYRLVQGHAMRAWEEELDFPELVRADSDLTSRLDAATLDSIFDLGHYARHVDTVFERLHALDTKEEPVHA